MDQDDGKVKIDIVRMFAASMVAGFLMWIIVLIFFSFTGLDNQIKPVFVRDMLTLLLSWFAGALLYILTVLVWWVGWGRKRD